MKFIFIELPFFEKYRADYLSDEEYRTLQNELLNHPEKGDLIQRTGGLRKIRIADGTKIKAKEVVLESFIIYILKNHILYFSPLMAKKLKTI